MWKKAGLQVAARLLFELVRAAMSQVAIPARSVARRMRSRSWAALRSAVRKRITVRTVLASSCGPTGSER
jgi:hypothetical protein